MKKNLILNGDFRQGTLDKTFGASDGNFTSTENLVPGWDAEIDLDAGNTGDVRVVRDALGGDDLNVPPELSAHSRIFFDGDGEGFQPLIDEVPAVVAISQTIPDALAALAGEAKVAFWVFSDNGGRFKLDVTKSVTRGTPVVSTVLSEVIQIEPGWTHIQRPFHVDYEGPYTTGGLSATSLKVKLTVHDTDEFEPGLFTDLVSVLQHGQRLSFTAFYVGPVDSDFDVADESVRRQPKVYRALVSQTGSDAPVATVLENTLGVLAWTRGAQGVNRMTTAALFTTNKTLVRVGPPSSVALGPGVTYVTYTSASVIDITTLDNADVAQDELLKSSFIEILVYP